MSLLSRDRMLIYLAPGELAWLRLAGAMKREVIAKRVTAVEPGYGARPWDGAIEALRSEAQQWSRHRLSVNVVLSNHFVRYALVPPSDAVQGHAEELALARFHFQKVHGEISQGWEVRLNPAHRGGPRLGCAIDAALVESLRQLFPRARAPRLDSVLPLLMPVVNNGAASIPANGAWVVTAEHDRACVALLKGKTCHAVQNVKGKFADVDSWIGLIERERWRTTLDDPPDTLLIHTDQTDALTSRNQGTWKISSLQMRWPTGLTPVSDRAYLNALLAR